MKIGIIGVGILGGAMKKYYEENHYEVFCYDKYIDKYRTAESLAKVNEADIVFICVPTPRGPNNECSVSIVEEAIGYVAAGDYKIIVIKSTVTPFTTDYLQDKYPHFPILFIPEFLTEKRAYTDFKFPKIQLVGYTRRSESRALGILSILPISCYNKVMPAAAAEMFKYVRNCQLATKNAFFNQIYSLCQATGINYDFIKETAENDPWIGAEHLDIWRDNKRGFNGKCLPKDSEAFLVWAREKGVDLTILKQAIEFNSKLLASQNIKKES